MPKSKNNIYIVIKLFSILVFIYLIFRVLFYLFNLTNYTDLDFTNLIYVLITGIRFDLSALIVINSIFILLFLYPHPIIYKKGFQKTCKYLFITTNSIGILANCIDLVYFPFTLKRLTADSFNFFSGKIGDFERLLPVFIKDYWYIFIIWIIATALLYIAYNKIVKNISDNKIPTYLISIGIAIFFYRGGFAHKPITITDASKYAEAKYIPLVINSPFSIIKTIDATTIEQANYFSNGEEKKHFIAYRNYPDGDFQELNVVMIILESFSKEFVSTLNNRNISYTPFLDSLINNGYVCTNAYSNGKKSIEALPAIEASIPSWMNQPYILSAYGTNQINSLANTLKQKGYYSAFFHGATNGSMGFDAFAKTAGYDDYFGRYEYGNDEHFDGRWGIWDEEFLQFFANTINTKKAPFLATVFTLTSHHPYNIPEKYSKQFPEGIYYDSKCIAYTDYSLKRFFETSSKMPWYNNTLFVLCADHTGISGDPYYLNNVGSYTIPIVFYSPQNNLKGKNNNIVQQIDIMPSILDYLNYDNPFFAFGKSIFDSTATNYSLNFNSGMYQYLNNNYLLVFDGVKSNELYAYKTDSLLKNNLLLKEKNVTEEIELKTKAIIQTYQYGLINNKTIIK